MFWIGVIAFILTMAAIWCGVPLAVMALDGWIPGTLVWGYLLTGLLTGGWFAYMLSRNPDKYQGDDQRAIMLTFLVIVVGWPWTWASVANGIWRRYRD